MAGMDAMAWSVLVGIYLMPSLLALLFGHRNWLAILLMNALLGWTVLCWFSAWYMLFWPLTWEGRMERQVADLRAELAEARRHQDR